MSIGNHCNIGFPDFFQVLVKTCKKPVFTVFPGEVLCFEKEEETLAAQGYKLVNIAIDSGFKFKPHHAGLTGAGEA